MIETNVSQSLFAYLFVEYIEREKQYTRFLISFLKMAGYEYSFRQYEGCPAIVHHLKVPCFFEKASIHNHNKSLNTPAYFILEFYCKPNCQVPKLLGYQIVKLLNYQFPNCQVTKLLVTKLLVTNNPPIELQLTTLLRRDNSHWCFEKF